MPPSFTITTPAAMIPVTTAGTAEVVFTVTNTSGVPSRAMAKVMPSGDTHVEWLSIAGESERDFAINGAQQFAVTARVSADVPEGNYPFRLVVVSARKASEERVEGPVVTLAVPARAVAAPKTSKAWLIAVFAFLLVAAVAGFLLTRKTGDAKTAVVDTTGTAATAGTTAATTTTAKGSITVPDFTKKPIAEATKQAAELGLIPIQQNKASDAPAGTVISQSPQVGWVVPAGQQMHLYTSQGPLPVLVPDLMGKSWKEAKLILDSVGLQAKRIDKKADFESFGRVIDQDPKPDSPLPRGATVEVTVGDVIDRNK